MRQPQAFTEQLQRDRCHDTRSGREHASIYTPRGTQCGMATGPRLVGCPDPERGDTRTGRLAHASQYAGPAYGLPTGIEGEVERQCHGKALGDVVDEERQENSQTERGVGMIRRKGNEALWELMQGYGKGGLQADGEEGILRDMVVVLARGGWLLESLEGCRRHGTTALGR